MERNVSESKVYDMAKYLTVLLVVAAHATRMYTPLGAVHPINSAPSLAVFTEVIYRFHMPLFIFISGAVYGFCIDKGKYDRPLAFIGGKAKRLLLPYIVFGIGYVAPVMYFLGLSDHSFWQYVRDGIVLSRNSRHLWYLLALFWIFMITIPLRSLLRRSAGFRLTLTAALIVLSAVGATCVSPLFQWQSAIKQLPFFFTGVCFHYLYPWFEKAAAKLWFVCLPLTLLWLLPTMLGESECLTMITAYAGIVISMTTAWGLVRWCSSFTNTWWYTVISKHSFGIYLFHPMIIYALYAYLGPFRIHPYILTIGAIVAAIALSVLATRLMRLLRLHVLIGE